MRLKSNFLLIFLFPFAFSGSCSQMLFSSIFPSTFLGVFLVAVGISLGFTLLVFLFSKMSNSPRASQYYKDEMFHLFMTFAIVVSVSGSSFLFCLFGDLIHYISTGSQTFFLDSAVSGISRMESDAETVVSSLIKGSIEMEMWSTWSSTYTNFFGNTVSTSPDMYRKSLSVQFELEKSLFALPALISLRMQSFIVKNSGILTFSVLVPVGMVLRLFPVSREMGNTFIGIAVALTTVFPLFYSVSADFYSSSSSFCNGNPNLFSDQILGLECSDDIGFFLLGSLVLQAFFVPNLALSVSISVASSVRRALNGVSL